MKGFWDHLGPVVEGLVLLGGGLVVWIRTFWMVMAAVVEVLMLLLEDGLVVVGATTFWMVGFWKVIVQFFVWTLQTLVNVDKTEQWSFIYKEAGLHIQYSFNAWKLRSNGNGNAHRKFCYFSGFILSVSKGLCERCM